MTTGSAVPTRLSSRVGDHGPRILRYCGVSVVNVTVSQCVLVTCLETLKFGAIASVFWATTMGTIPAYILSRRWVWKQTGRDSFTTEVLPFWIMAFTGLVMSMGVVALIVDKVTDRTIIVMFSMLAASGVVWVCKYLVLDRVMWRVAGDLASGRRNAPSGWRGSDETDLRSTSSR